LFIAVWKLAAIELLASINPFMSDEPRLLGEALSAVIMRTAERTFTCVHLEIGTLRKHLSNYSTIPTSMELFTSMDSSVRI
jgi:hypothetical protein